MENRDFTTDLAMLSQSLIYLRENLTYTEFDALMFAIQDANDKGKLSEFLSQVTFLHTQGSDLATALEHAHFDVVQDVGENF